MYSFYFFFQAEDGIRDFHVTGVQTCALPICVFCDVPGSGGIMTKDTARNIAYWTTTVLGPASFVIGGILHLTQNEQVIATRQHLGYPAYFATILGVGKLCGAIAVVVPGIPRLKEWAYAGFFFNLTA